MGGYGSGDGGRDGDGDGGDGGAYDRETAADDDDDADGEVNNDDASRPMGEDASSSFNVEKVPTDRTGSQNSFLKQREPVSSWADSETSESLDTVIALLLN